MKHTHPLFCIALFVPFTLAACSDTGGGKAKGPTDDKGTTSTKAVARQGEDGDVAANLAKLDPADRKLAESQKFCAVEQENQLGSMGKPFKLTVKDQAVFLCCKGCQRRALADPEKTLSKVEQLRTKTATSSATK